MWWYISNSDTLGIWSPPNPPEADLIELRDGSNRHGKWIQETIIAEVLLSCLYLI
jgi:hypothetical protein